MIPISTSGSMCLNVEIQITNEVCAIQTTYLEMMHSHPYYFFFTQFFHDHNFDPYSSS